MIEFGITDNFLGGWGGVMKNNGLAFGVFEGGGIMKTEFFGGVGGVGF